MKSRNLILIVILLIVIVIVGGYFIFKGGYQAPSQKGAPGQITTPSPEAPPAGEVPPPPGVPVREITVIGTEFSFNPPSITVSAGERVKVNFKNEGAAPHNFVIAELGVGTNTIGGGKTDTVEFTAPSSGKLTFYCSVSGHRQRGMEGEISVQ